MHKEKTTTEEVFVNNTGYGIIKFKMAESVLLPIKTSKMQRESRESWKTYEELFDQNGMDVLDTVNE